MFGFWLRRALGGCAESEFPPGAGAEHKNNCSGFGVSGLARRAASSGPVDFTWSPAAEESRAHEQLFAFLAPGQVSCSTNISGSPLHSQRQMIDKTKCIFLLTV
jgi:hypothetical protein